MSEKRENAVSLFARLLVEWRRPLAILMGVFTVISLFLIPRIRINDDLTSNLPDDSPMREGLSILEKDFPGLDIRMQTLRVMFVAEEPSDTLQTALESLLERPSQLEVRQNGPHTLYQYFLPKEADGDAVKEAVKGRFGDRVQVEVEDNSGIPEHLFQMIATGFIICLLILVLMSPTFLETVLFLLAFGMGILINTGSNAFLPSITLITNSLAAVLQLALSIDYAIILMNRYRQERKDGEDITPAMARALSKATPAILGSALTTIVSLLMLCFMRLKMGADLGIVLSKGVFCSLVVTFTVLPALILRFDKSILATQKKVPVIPTQGLARFEWKFRVPLFLVSVSLLAGAWLLQRKTDMFYSVTRPTPITQEFPPRNRMLALYPTAEEAAVIPMVDELTRIPGVSCISYPSIAMKPRTATDLATLAPDLTEQVPLQVLDLLYYAATHPERKERMTLEELETSAEDLARLAGQLLPEASGLDVGSRFDLSSLLEEPEEEPVPEEVPEEEPLPEQPADTLLAHSVPTDTSLVAEHIGPVPAEPLREPEDVSEAPEDDFDWSYEAVTKPRTAAEMAEYLPVESRYIKLVYRMSDVGRRGRLSAYEFMSVVSEKVLGNKRYLALIPKESLRQMYEARDALEAAVAAGPSPVADSTLLAQAEIPPMEDTVMVAALPQEERKLELAVPELEMPEEAEMEEEPTPLDMLIETALSGKRCNAVQSYRLLSNAGIPVKQEEIDLLYLYHGYETARDTTTQLSLLELTGFLEDLLENSLLGQYLDSARIEQLNSLKRSISEDLGILRTPQWSVVVVTGDLPEEGPETFGFIENLQQLCQRSFSGPTYQIGFSVMYYEMKSGFSRELLVLTLLTAIAIFLIVALTFRSPVIPLLLVSTVLTAVWLCVAISGIGGTPMHYISYLVLQSILMGSSVDYSILFTNYYREARQGQAPGESLKAAFKGSINTILTSGLIMVLGTLLMSITISDPLLKSVMRSIFLGSLIAILLILFVLPGVLALLDRWVRKRNPSNGAS